MRRRIVVLAVLAAILATSLFGIPLAIGAAAYYLSDERGELERLADTAAIAVSADLVQGQLPDSLAPPQAEAALGLYDAAGVRVLGQGPVAADDLVVEAMSGLTARGVEGGDLVVAVPVTDDEGVIAVVRSATPRSAVYARTLATWLVMVGLAAVAVALTWLVARRQAVRLAAPLESLSSAAAALGEGDFSVRTQRSGIAEIDTAGRSLDSTAQRLDAMLARERAFSANASHQLRTPLTGLRLGLEAAVDTPGPGSTEALRAALSGVDRLERTIDDLLTLARQPAQGGRSMELSAAMAEIKAEWHALLAEQGRPLRLVMDSDLPGSSASGAAVRQILAVLLDNAVRHGRGCVTVTARDAGGPLAVDVSDEGPGLRASATPESRPLDDHHGRGLELARSLAEAEGGRLVARTGSPLFTLLLPADSQGTGRCRG